MTHAVIDRVYTPQALAPPAVVPPVASTPPQTYCAPPHSRSGAERAPPTPLHVHTHIHELT